jgi:hypothetical protein
MESLINEAYEFEQVDDNKSNVKYDFVSIGEKEVPKRVAIIQYQNKGLEKFYNLGFGNISIDDEGNEQISDMSRENNTDKDKVLKTVITCTLHFLSNYPNSIITFYGNTSAKHRLYKIGINNNLEAIKSYLKVKGGIIKNLKIIENDEDGKFPAENAGFENIDFEEYNINRSNNYNFIIFELKDKFK